MSLLDPAALRLPVIVAPMFLISSPDLVVAACRSGVVGSFPTPNCRSLDELDAWMAEIAARLSPHSDAAPWAVNLVTHSTNARLGDDLALVSRYRPPVVITALGSPAAAVETVHDYGGTLIADVGSVDLARKAVAAGADGLALLTAGAGGHTGHLSAFAFVSAVREFFDGLVVMSGGIADGAGIAGAVAAGADLVSMGTRFLACDESSAVPDYKRMVVDHGIGDLVVSDAITGTAASWLRPSLAACGFDPDRLASQSVERDYDSSTGGHRRWKDVWAAGQGLGAVRAIEPVAQIVDKLETQYEDAVARFRTRVS